jgi:hypothetical protein
MAAHVILDPSLFSASNVGLGRLPWPAPQHLRLLDEFVFRFNRRRTRHAAFRSLLGIVVVRKPATYKMLITPEARA